MKRLLAIWLGKIINFISSMGKFGAGSTWPGHVSLKINPKIISQLTSQLKKGTILIAGTNGKTTTVKLISQILKEENPDIIINDSGANLLNGLASTLINKSDWLGKIKASWAVFETDEATLPLALAETEPKIVIILNLFRDQLDRYGEIDLIAEKWQQALKKLSLETTVILNADDPHVAFLGKGLRNRVFYFGLNDKNLFLAKMEHAVDTVYCPSCNAKLDFEGVFFSHLGFWSCPGCRFSRPTPNLFVWDYPLSGTYNRYNTLAAVLAAKILGVEDQKINLSLQKFKPAFGRQEKINLNGKNVQILLAKNPAGFNECLRTLKDFPGQKKTVLLVLNDRIPDGQDVSWIWDVDFEIIKENVSSLLVSGDRAFDLDLRLKYADFPLEKTEVKIDLKEALKKGLATIPPKETFYILPTYSAMLEVRKILGGRKIL